MDGIGVANLMKAAGLTHGGFTGYSESKEELEVKACASACSPDRPRPAGDGRQESGRAAQGLADRYSTARHRDGPGEDASTRRSPRTSPDTTVRPCAAPSRPAWRPLIDTLVRIVPGRSKAARRQKALAYLSTMVGALILARAVDDTELSDEILAAARALSGEPSRRA